jgi:SAM-dependent methyltransferase
MLAQMYGPEYSKGFENSAAETTDPKEPQRVVEFLRTLPAGTFVDYGCGAGRLLAEAMKLGWKAIGVEFDQEVAASVSEQTGASVFADTAYARDSKKLADVLHLGDVIEHLTDLDHQMPEILKLIKPGGILMAQGPLEGNANLFEFAVRTARSMRRSHWTEMAPYHLFLPPASAQRRFFERFGLQEIEYTIHEVDWPAPSHLTLRDLRRPRALGLFGIRRISRAVSRLRPTAWGNRYFYIGQTPE